MRVHKKLNVFVINSIVMVIRKSKFKLMSAKIIEHTKRPEIILKLIKLFQQKEHLIAIFFNISNRIDQKL